MKACWKDAYKTVKKARRAASSASKKYGEQFHTYKCEQCGSFHLTKFSRKEYVQNKDNIKERNKK